jgi:hypothetical protein
MKTNQRPKEDVTKSKPTKVLLHMAEKDEEWAGVAIRLDTEERHRFRNLNELRKWLKSLCRPKGGNA